jgi:phosphatidylglycerophosphate synthase
MARPFIRAGVRPDTITYVSLLFAVIAWLVLLVFHLQVEYGVLVFIVGILDGLDGAVARGSSRSSRSGALTDSVVDKAAEVVLLTAIATAFPDDTILGLPTTIWVGLCISGWLLTSYTRSRAESLGVADLDVGLGGRSERLLILAVFSLVGFLLWGLVVSTLLGLLTAGYRFNHYKAELRKADRIAS